MTDIILVTIFGLFILVAFIKGVQIGVKLRKDEPIEMPKIISPLSTAINTSSETKLTKEEQRDWENFNNYDGTVESQKPIENR